MTEVRHLRILMIEDLPSDAELNARELRRAGFDFEWRRVDTAEAVVSELRALRPDVILSDYSMPRLNGLEALHLCLAHSGGAPFVIVTGSINEETAVGCIKAGATDYVTKEHLVRLGPAVRSALGARVLRDQKERAEQTLRLHGAALQAAANGIVITDRDGLIEWVNPAFTEITGYRSEEAVGQNPRILRSSVQREGFYRNLWETILAGQVWRGEMENRRKDGSHYSEEMTITPVRVSGNQISHFVAIMQDVSARKRQDEEIHRLATLDPLTRLPNRATLHARLDAAVSRASRGLPGALILVDIDRFRIVNDSLGPSAGDQLLVLVAERLGALLRPGDTLARTGGDDFAVLMETIDAEGARGFADRLRAEVAQLRFTSGDHVFDLTASTGTSLVDGSTSAEVLLARADEALYAAKDLGTSRSVLWGGELERRPPVTESTKWVARLNDALRTDRLVLHYQPVVSLRDGSVEHYEALVRMRDEAGVLVQPGAFLPIAERFGLMPAVDRRVVELSLDLLSRDPLARLFVNLSGGSLSDESLLSWIEEEVRRLGLARGRLTFEITETTAVADLVWVQRWIRSLRELGCSFAIDDFGTGFSSFAYLRSLPVDFVKIDGSFIRDLDTNPTSSALVHAMVTVAHALGKEVIAEMVERQSVADVLRGFGVEYGQGWLWGRPDTELRGSSTASAPPTIVSGFERPPGPDR